MSNSIFIKKGKRNKNIRIKLCSQVSRFCEKTPFVKILWLFQSKVELFTSLELYNAQRADSLGSAVSQRDWMGGKTLD